MKNNNRGEIVIGLLVGLAIGAAMLVIKSGNYAQNKANELGMPVSGMQYLADAPGAATIDVLLPAVAGAGVGWLLDEAGVSGSKKKSTVNNATTIRVEGESHVINIRGDETVTTDTRTDTRTDNSVREAP
ncbi:MAG TPA: hypothetical protein PKE26_11035 [Kiritimatiellia bacterium]|nr:hypothetical protein [Kiritimatiellia bacterium]HMO99633.1 hypothetical protein [Kiritimatiellia bacterium]HMP97120.1 hypothetical protein [Kiritimatiellia bacterium]